MDSENLVFGTNYNHLYLYNLSTLKFELKKNLSQHRPQDLALFAGSTAKTSEITALAMVKDQ